MPQDKPINLIGKTLRTGSKIILSKDMTENRLKNAHSGAIMSSIVERNAIKHRKQTPKKTKKKAK
jgi:hypothetical protein